MSAQEPMASELETRLRKQHETQRYRTRVNLNACSGTECVVDGRKLINFCSNDYLGLKQDSRVISAFTEAAQQWGVGSGASHLISGHTAVHHKLEERIAAWTGRERALVFSTGYMANLGVISALCDRSTSIIEDKLVHASLLDAAKLSNAKLLRFKHNDVKHLQTLLEKNSREKVFIAVDGVFSMDGDLCPAKEIAELAQKKSAQFMIDDAHGLGCLGEKGFGICDLLRLGQNQVPILMGTLGKALGTFGAFVAGSEALIESLIQFARSYIYTTALPPAVAAATEQSIRICQQENWRRDRLNQLIEFFKSEANARELNLLPSNTAIQPLLMENESSALKISQALKLKGFWVVAVRPPTVPENSSRLRITLSTLHTEQQITELLDSIYSSLK